MVSSWTSIIDATARDRLFGHTRSAAVSGLRNLGDVGFWTGGALQNKSPSRPIAGKGLNYFEASGRLLDARCVAIPVARSIHRAPNRAPWRARCAAINLPAAGHGTSVCSMLYLGLRTRAKWAFYLSPCCQRQSKNSIDTSRSGQNRA